MPIPADRNPASAVIAELRIFLIPAPREHVRPNGVEPSACHAVRHIAGCSDFTLQTTAAFRLSLAESPASRDRLRSACAYAAPQQVAFAVFTRRFFDS